MCLLGKKWCRTWCATKGTEKKKWAVYTKHLQCDVLSKNSEMNCGLTLKCNTNVFVWGMTVTNISFLSFKTHIVGLLQGSDCMRKYDPIPQGSSLNCRWDFTNHVCPSSCFAFITSLNRIYPAVPPLTRSGNSSPRKILVGWETDGETCSLPGLMESVQKDVKVVSVFVRGQTLEGNRGEGWTRNKKEYTRMCRHVAKTHIYHDL